jgi:NADH-quinone oxidoreductase subunit A
VPEAYIPILILLALAAGFSAVSLGVSFFLGKQRPTSEKNMAYECGIVPETSARGRFSVKFFLVAMLFIVFDVETIFLFPWAVVFREMPSYAFVAILPFMLLLVASLIYEWKRGALEWD